MTLRQKVTSILVAIAALIAISQTAQAEGEIMITTTNGVAQYPDGYQGTPHRAPDEDPFISPSNAALILIDFQPHILMGVKSIDHDELINNTTALIKSAVHFGVPIVFSHVGVGFNGSQPFIEELRAMAPDAVVIDRTNVNAWEEPEFVAAVEATGRKKLIMGGLWTDVCLAYPAIEAANAGYDVLVPEDTVGSITQLSHDNGMKRMQAAGVKAITWNVVLAELQRDHARSSTEREVTRIFMEYLFKMDPDKEWK
jgi:nicotinamidase-related amidase